MLARRAAATWAILRAVHDAPSWEPFGFTEEHRESAPMPRAPARRLIVLTCMDARIDPLEVLGLRLGDAHVIRNAGAEITPDVLHSVRLSQSAGGTERAWIVGHTDCAARQSDEDAEVAVEAAVAALTAAVPTLDVVGAIYDVRTRTHRRVACPRQ